jgi:hypothetical protein
MPLPIERVKAIQKARTLSSIQFPLTSALETYQGARTPTLFSQYSPTLCSPCSHTLFLHPVPTSCYNCLDILPKKIFSQPRSPTRGRNRKQSLKMQPLDWQTLVRLDQPFEKIYNPLDIKPAPRPPIRPWLALEPRGRGEDYEGEDYVAYQMRMWSTIATIDPNLWEPEVMRPGPLKVPVYSLSNPLLPLSLQIRRLFAMALHILLDIFNFFHFLFSGVSSLVYRLVTTADWKLLFMLAAAWQLAGYLPGMAGGMLADGGEADSPVYTIFVPGGKAIW